MTDAQAEDDQVVTTDGGIASGSSTLRFPVNFGASTSGTAMASSVSPMQSQNVTGLFQVDC